VATLALRRSTPDAGALKSIRVTLTRWPGPTSIVHGVVGDPQPVCADTTLDSRPSEPLVVGDDGGLRHTPPTGVTTARQPPIVS